MTKGCAWLLGLLAVFTIWYVGKAAALSGSGTVVVYNSAKEKIYARVVEKSSSSGSLDYAVRPNGIKYISFEQGKDYALFRIVTAEIALRVSALQGISQMLPQ